MKMKISARLLSMGVALVAALNCCADELKPLDILGLQLDMTADEALAKLGSIDPRMKIERGEINIPALSDKPILHSLFAYRMPPGVFTDYPEDCVEIRFTLPPNKPQVWKVGRTLRYQQGQEIAKTGLLSALRGKYGNETVFEGKGSATWGYYWVRDPEGKLVEGTSGLKCLGYFKGNRAITGTLQQPGDATRLAQALLGYLNYPDQVPPTMRQGQSKSYVSAVIDLAESDGELVKLMHTMIADAALEKRATDATRAVLAGAAADAEKLRLEKARQQGVPKL